MSEEIWRDLEIEFTNNYRISSYGRFLRKDSNRLSIGFEGQITLSNNNETKNFHLFNSLRERGEYK